MPKSSANQTQEIIDLLSRHPDGIGIDDISRQLGNEIPRRTLQRRLAALLEQGHIQTRGDARATRYRPAAIHDTGVRRIEARQSNTDYESELFLSPEGKEIRDYVRQPLHLRRPVAYDISFLENYHPNQSFYLPEALRNQLHQLGRSSRDQAAAGTFARDIMNRLLIDLSWASSQLEGNTYSRLDTARLIEFGQAAEGKDATETQMILNHKEAIEYLVRDVDRVGVNTETILNLHAFLSDGLLQDPQAVGRVRVRAVGISRSVYRPIAYPQKLEELFGIVIEMAAEIHDPLEQAFFLMVHLPYLQPFLDVNKRVSRLAANIPLIRSNLCALSFIDVAQRAYADAILGVYELNRVEFLRDVFVSAYERSCQQYLAVRQQLVPPDTFRLRYRSELSEAVRAIVRGGLVLNEDVIQSVVPPSVGEADRERFVALVSEEFASMHAGNAIRFGLRGLEFDEWRANQVKI